MVDTLQDSLKLEDMDEIVLTEAETLSLGEILGDLRDTKNGIVYNFPQNVSRSYTSTVSDITRS